MLNDLKDVFQRTSRDLWQDLLGASALMLAFLFLFHLPILF
ncbi:hypothetical protein [Qingshengfaniella alkalisoli]|nr:hypothetical protein [Qingshengfaniella alkalisoli]